MSQAEEECLELQQQITRLDEVLHSIIPKCVRKLTLKSTLSSLCRFEFRSVANRLANGEEVQPEMWENVTVFEADLVGFTEIARERTPLGVTV